jgi:hypothetical protein
MKTSKLINLAMILITVIGITISGCKKDENTDPPPTDTNSLQQLAKDQNSVQSASDDGLNDVNDVMSGGSKQVNNMPCNMTVDSSSIVGDTITYNLTFNGLNCAGTRFRLGNIVVKRNITTPWGQAGTMVFVKFIDFKVTRVSDNKYVIINGTKSYQNVNGGLIRNLGTGGLTSVTVKIAGTLLATFDDGTVRAWNVARIRTFTGIPTQLIETITGYGSADGYNNLLFWGTNRNGELFYTQIQQAVVAKQVCQWDPVSGVVVHQIPSGSKKATGTFGYDDNNLPITGSNCPTKYKLDWEKDSNSGTVYLSLHN